MNNLKIVNGKIVFIETKNIKKMHRSALMSHLCVFMFLFFLVSEKRLTNKIITYHLIYLDIVMEIHKIRIYFSKTEIKYILQYILFEITFTVMLNNS